MTAALDPKEMVERYFTVIKSLNEFDKKEVRGKIQTLLLPSNRDLCFTGAYYRAAGNIESTLCLKSIRDFQAIAMMARSLFEIAVDLALTAQIPDSETKILAFVDLEKLRAARKIVEFKSANPTPTSTMVPTETLSPLTPPGLSRSLRPSGPRVTRAWRIGRRQSWKSGLRG